jgi:hypothetical protein
MKLSRFQKQKILNLQGGLIQTFPYFHRLYQQLPRYKKMVLTLEKQARLRQEYTNKILKNVFRNKMIVRHGPFKGMRYIRESFGSLLLPKILGSYEEPIHEWIEEAIVKKYDTVIDVGCAEGYYAVGLALALPNSNIFARDIDEKAQELIKKLAEINNVENILVGGELTHREISRLPNNSLLMCDIEGAEVELLDPSKAPKLRNVDIIVEAHDLLRPNTTEVLIERFSDTHRIKIVVDYPKNYSRYLNRKTLSKLNTRELKKLFHERPEEERMKWLRMTSLKNE